MSKLNNHKPWLYEDFVFVIENYPTYSIKQIASQLERTFKSVSMLLGIVKTWKKEGDGIAQRGYSPRMILFCKKYFGKEDVDVSSKGKTIKNLSNKNLVEHNTEVQKELSPLVQGKIALIDGAIENMKRRVVEVIEQVLTESDHVEELKSLRIKVEEQKEKLKEFDKYKEAAKSSSVWGVLTRKFGAHNQ
jgi:hypothetical protein